MNIQEPNLDLPKVLVVDDQAINIQALFEIFNGDYEVFMATSGEQALAVLQEVLPDLILLDVLMPGMGGHELCRELKRTPRTAGVPVIFVTAQNDPEQEAQGLELGAVDFISKPLNAPVVRARVRTHLALKRQGDFLRSLAFVDGLTGIANRRHFDQNLDIEWRDCMRNQYPISLIMIDIDHFKRYNDHYGHPQGDACLRSVGALVSSNLGRAHDLAARYGGEEFVCVMPNCTLDGAIHVALRIRGAVEEMAIPHAASDTARHVTISLGVASVVPTEALHFSELVKCADGRLYEAKQGGRNRVHPGDISARKS